MYLHVDDGIFMCERGPTDPQRCDTQMEASANSLEALGFLVKDRTGDAQLEKAVGYAIQRSPARWQVPDKKAALLYESLMYVRSPKWVYIPWLDSLVGIWIFYSPLRRSVLSIPHAIFKFLDKHKGQGWVCWWQTAKDECWSMATAVMALYADTGAPVSCTIFAGDARGGTSSR